MSVLQKEIEAKFYVLRSLEKLYCTYSEDQRDQAKPVLIAIKTIRTQLKALDR